MTCMCVCVCARARLCVHVCMYDDLRWRPNEEPGLYCTDEFSTNSQYALEKALAMRHRVQGHCDRIVQGVHEERIDLCVCARCVYVRVRVYMRVRVRVRAHATFRVVRWGGCTKIRSATGQEALRR